MKCYRVFGATLALILIWSSTGYGQQTAEELFQAGLHQEEVQGDLETAIDLFERILADHPGQRTVAARALMHIGLCHEKLGSFKAQGAYERLVRDYADQADLVALARLKLVLLREPEPAEPESSIVARHIWGGRYAEGPDGGPDASGGPSPDGRYLAYVDWRSGDVALRDLVTGESRRLTNDGDIDQGHFAFEADFSPDGRYVAYAWLLLDDTGNGEMRNAELRVVGLDGTPPRVLYSDSTWAGEFAWSHDGKRIATSRERTGGGLDLFTVSAEDGSVTPLKGFDESFSPGICFSPDDRYVALEIPVDGDLSRRDIWLVATDGIGDAVPLVEHPADDRPVGWVPGMQELLFVSDRSGTRDLWAVEVVGREVKGSPRPVRRDVGDLWPLGFADDGTLFHAVYTHRHHTFVVAFELETGEIDLAAATPLLGSNISPSWSPNGEYLALVRQDDVEMPPWRREFLVVYNLLTGEERRLALDIDLGFARLQWSPDGRSILFEGTGWTTSADERPTLYRVDVASGETTTLVELPGIIPRGASGAGAVWTADGQGIVYAYQGRLALRALASGQETELYRDEKLAGRLIALSPDGEWVAFGVGTSELHEMGHPTIRDSGRFLMVHVESREVREVTDADWSGQIRGIDWTADGEHLVFWVTSGEGATFLRVPRTGGMPQKLWTTDEHIDFFAIHPDGGRIAYTANENEMNIWVMENLGAALRGRDFLR